MDDCNNSVRMRTPRVKNQVYVFRRLKPKHFRGTAYFSFSPKHPYFLSFEEKNASFWGGDKNTSSPGGPCTTYINPKNSHFQPFHCTLSKTTNVRFQMIFQLFMPSSISWFRPAPSILENCSISSSNSTCTSNGIAHSTTAAAAAVVPHRSREYVVAHV